MKIGGQKLRRKQRQLTNGPYLPVEKTTTLEKRKQRAQRQRITWTSSRQQPPISPVQRKPKKCSTKAMKKSDREELLQSLNNIEEKFLLCEVNNELRATFDDDGLLKDFTNVLCSSDQLLRDIAVHHQHCFGALYVSSKMEQDAFTHFQFEWYKYCSVFLLSQEYTLKDINYQELQEYPVSVLRVKWLDFAKENGIPVPHCNQVMITLSSAVYSFLLDHVTRFQ